MVGNIITFKRNSWSKLPKKGSFVTVNFNSNGNDETLPLTLLFEVEEIDGKNNIYFLLGRQTKPK